MIALIQLRKYQKKQTLDKKKKKDAKKGGKKGKGAKLSERDEFLKARN